MASVSTVEVTDIKTGKTLVINETDFNSALYKRGSVGKGAGTKVPVPSSFKKKTTRSRKDNK